MAYLLGLDVGTTNTKAVLYEVEGRVRAVATAPTPVTEAGPGQAIRDPEALYGVALGVIREAVAQAEDPAEVLGLSVSSMGEAGVPLDERGQPVYPIIAWYDRRTMGCQSWQRRLGEDRLFSICGLQPGHIFSLNKILWLREHEPGAYRRLRCWLSVSDYVAYRLSGAAAMSYPQACRTMAFDLHSLDWSAEVLECAGIPPGIFPRAVPSGQALGTVRPQAAGECGLTPRTVVAVGGHDHICAAVAAGVVEPGAMLDSIGTTEALLAVLERPRVQPVVHELGLSCGVHAVPGRYYLIGGVLGVGPLVTWLARTLLDLPPTEEGYRALAEAAQASPPGAQGLYLLPFLAGGGAPALDPEAAGAYLGLRLHHTRADMVRAGFEGLCYELCRLLESFQAVGAAPQATLRAIGGGARNPFWLQLRADVTGYTIQVPRATEGAALGAALLAGLGAGLYADLPAASAEAYQPAKVYQPDAEAHRQYSARYEGTYRQLVQARRLPLA